MLSQYECCEYITAVDSHTKLMQGLPLGVHLGLCCKQFSESHYLLDFQLELPHASRSCCPWVANATVFRTASAGQSFGSFMLFCRCFLFSPFSACSLAPCRCHSGRTKAASPSSFAIFSACCLQAFVRDANFASCVRKVFGGPLAKKLKSGARMSKRSSSRVALESIT